MKLKAVPAVAAAGALTVKCVAAAALTVMASLVPVMLAVTRVGGGDGLAAGGLSVALKVPMPLVSGACWPAASAWAVAAGEVDRAGVAGGGVAERVLGGDGEVEAPCPPWPLVGALTVKCVAAAGADGDRCSVPVMELVDGVGGRERLAAGRDQGGAVKVPVPLVKV